MLDSAKIKKATLSCCLLYFSPKGISIFLTRYTHKKNKSCGVLGYGSIFIPLLTIELIYHIFSQCSKSSN